MTTTTAKRQTKTTRSAAARNKPVVANTPKAKAKVRLPKCAGAKQPVAKPTALMEQRIASIGKHPGKALRIKRFASYKVGMSLAHCKATEGLDHLDIGFYVEHGLMKLRPATEKEMQAATAEWEAKQKKNKSAKAS